MKNDTHKADYRRQYRQHHEEAIHERMAALQEAITHYMHIDVMFEAWYAQKFPEESGGLFVK